MQFVDMVLSQVVGSVVRLAIPNVWTAKPVDLGPELARFPDLSTSISELMNIRHEDTFRLHDLAREFAAHGTSTRGNAQWKLGRLIQQIEALATRICDTAQCQYSDEEYRQVVYCKEEVLPRLTLELEDVLYNHLVSKEWM